MDSTFKQLVSSKWKFKLFLLKNLPAAYFSGVRLVLLTDEKTIVKVKYKWFSKNPFGSTYFACLAMAAEMASGILALGNIWKKNPKISMLVVDIKGEFYKKAIGETFFTCKEGNRIAQAVKLAITSGNAIEETVLSKGVNKDNEPIADFYVTWSFKAKK